MPKKDKENTDDKKRKTFFCDDVMAAALDLYSTYTKDNNSEIVIAGLKKVIPNEFFEMARKSVNAEEVK